MFFTWFTVHNFNVSVTDAVKFVSQRCIFFWCCSTCHCHNVVVVCARVLPDVHITCYLAILPFIINE